MLWIYAAGLHMGMGSQVQVFKPWWAAGANRVLTGGVV